MHSQIRDNCHSSSARVSRSPRRNSLRLLKLVNTLLDFSRIEAGRMQAAYEPVDLASLTADLASVFRSAFERAGLSFAVNCPPLGEPVYIDREMWEKIVLNLLSNAFKFTLDGEIVVSLNRVGKTAEFSVRDTGSGILPDDLPHVFERFYRAKNTQNRSNEGSGIGLALVHDLVKLNGGSVRLDSEFGQGSTFTVSIPLGSAHLPADRIGAICSGSSTALGANAFVEEAEHWFPADAPHQSPATAVTVPESTPRPRIVLAEDNADMRDYLERLLAGVYRVESVNDGKAALETILRDPPDLVLTDVMMPQLDGFALLKALRADPNTASIPIILLSARAGEESRVDGIKAGADDYLIKPFSAREIVARVENHIALSRLRHEGEDRLRRSEERFRALVSASSDVIFRISPDWSEIWKLEGRGFLAASELPARSWLEAYIDPEDQPQVQQAIETAIGNKAPFELEHRIRRADGSLGWSFSRAVPLLDAGGEITEWFGAARDITSRKQSEEALLRSEKLATLGRMAATIAHEINNPLESVTNLLFLANHNGDLPDQTQNLLRMADVELQRVAHIARQSLGFYRESNAPALTSVNDLLDSAVELLKGKVSEKRATIGKDWKSDTKITAVAGELRQVFSNLLANSLDAIDVGGKLRIRVTELVAAAGPDAIPHPHSVRITFVDNGRGIHPSIRRHIFEPFFTTKGTVGTGLGLWVTRQIVDKHGGTISVHSCTTGNQKGTAFSIVLPIEAVPAWLPNSLPVAISHLRE